MTLTDDDRLESLADTIRTCDAQSAQIAEVRAGAASEALAIIGEQAGPIEANGKPVLTVTYTRRFNADLAVKVLSPTLVEAIKVLTISSAMAKATLPPLLYARCQKTTAPSIKATS